MKAPSTESSVTLTDRGRALCDQLTEELYEEYDTDPYSGWKQLTAIHDFGWSVGSGNRVAGRLPPRMDGEPIVQGPHNYVLKIEFDAPDEASHTELSNWIETVIWKQAAERGVTDLFAPVIDHASDYRWLVMEEVETIGYDYPNRIATPQNEETAQQQQEYERRVASFESRLADAGLGLGLDGEGQIGVSRTGNVVALDYEHVTDESVPDQPAWVGSYNQHRGRRLTPNDINISDRRRDRLRRIANGTDGSVTGYEIRSRISQWRT